MSIDGIGSRQINAPPSANDGSPRDSSGAGFGQVLSRVADGALRGVAAVAPAFPGGQLVSMAATGLRELRSAAPAALTTGQDDQVQQMFEMQKQSQAFNLQYLQLQTELQDDNRKFSTLTNLMKVRHDTVKAAINNMHA